VTVTRAVGERLRDELLSRGAVVDPLEAIRAVTGHAPSVGPMLERRGLR
jgi:peptidyl-dipeptidase Dcp